MLNEDLDFYREAKKVFASGVQTYRVGGRQLAYMEPGKLQEMIDSIMLKIVMLQNGGRRRSWGVILRDF